MKFIDLLEPLPPELLDDLQPDIQEIHQAAGKTIVVLDDDPTGTQTVFDVPVLTKLDAESIAEALEEEPSMLFILTNSRALTQEQTTSLHEDLKEALKPFRDRIHVVSRSDSTLRGHFPLETDMLREPEMPTLFVPFFDAGGRLTIDEVHYVVEKGTATPAHETPFAQDEAFPFSYSRLPDYLEEKSEGRIKADDVESISLQLLRTGDPLEKLESLPDGSYCIVNAAAPCDIQMLAHALHRSKRRFIIRSAASFVQAFGGIPFRPPLSSRDLADPAADAVKGGLIVVGSHVPKTTAQLNHLRSSQPDLHAIELSVPDLLEDREATLEPIIAELNDALKADESVLLFTSRERVDSADGNASLDLAKDVSGALVEVVRSLAVRPRFFVSKGGITSSDLATKALEVERALVLGQAIPGVPVWTLGSETRFPGLLYVIFPGNVGKEDGLSQVVRKLRQ